MEKQQLPVTYCTNWGKVGHNISLANGRCGQMLDRKRCKGLNQSAIGINDWEECPTCAGTGWTGQRCVRCDGAGWLFVRGKHWNAN
jgi:hypothetical protein